MGATGRVVGSQAVPCLPDAGSDGESYTVL